MQILHPQHLLLLLFIVPLAWMLARREQRGAKRFSAFAESRFLLL